MVLITCNTKVLMIILMVRQIDRNDKMDSGNVFILKAG